MSRACPIGEGVTLLLCVVDGWHWSAWCEYFANEQGAEVEESYGEDEYLGYKAAWVFDSHFLFFLSGKTAPLQFGCSGGWTISVFLWSMMVFFVIWRPFKISPRIPHTIKSHAIVSRIDSGVDCAVSFHPKYAVSVSQRVKPMVASRVYFILLWSEELNERILADGGWRWTGQRLLCRLDQWGNRERGACPAGESEYNGDFFRLIRESFCAGKAKRSYRLAVNEDAVGL